ncbi:Uncharacterised protein [Neisseria weaveri]|nr:Uncharacterised protein [Neisseria weaveri]
MSIGRSDVQFLDIAVRIGAGVLFIARMEAAVFFYPPCIRVFAGGGFATDNAFVIHFDGLTLFAAGRLNNGGVNDGGGCFLYF